MNVQKVTDTSAWNGLYIPSVVRAVQLFIWPPLRFFFYYFGMLRVKGRQNIRRISGCSFIIVSNHISYLDMFLIAHLFPFGKTFFPIYYPTWPDYYFTWKRPFMWALGAYPIFKKEELHRTLAYSLKILRSGGRILIFPEGYIHRIGRHKKPRRGASFLAAECSVPILPCFIENFKPAKHTLGFSWKDLFLRKYRLRATFGSPFFIQDVYGKVPAHYDEYREASEKIIERVYQLRSEGKISIDD